MQFVTIFYTQKVLILTANNVFISFLVVFVTVVTVVTVVTFYKKITKHYLLSNLALL